MSSAIKIPNPKHYEKAPQTHLGPLAAPLGPQLGVEIWVAFHWAFHWGCAAVAIDAKKNTQKKH
jgi:hypothetical protein